MVKKTAAFRQRRAADTARWRGDFTRWKEHDSYQSSFDRLMRDLRVEKPGQ